MKMTNKSHAHTENVQAIVSDQYQTGLERTSYIHTGSCYECSKAKRTLIPPYHTYNEYGEYVRDVKFSCEVLNRQRKAPVKSLSSCIVGNRKFKNRRCSKCIHGSHAIDLTVKEDDTSNGTTVHKMYHCDLPEYREIILRGYYNCDKFEPKEGSKNEAHK